MHPQGENAHAPVSCVAQAALKWLCPSLVLTMAVEAACNALGHASLVAALPVPVICAFALLNACCASVTEGLRNTPQRHAEQRNMAAASTSSACAWLGRAETKCMLALACLVNCGVCAACGRLELAAVPLAIAAAGLLGCRATAAKCAGEDAAARGAVASWEASQNEDGEWRAAWQGSVRRQAADVALSSSLLTFGTAVVPACAAL